MSLPAVTVEALFDGAHWTDISGFLRAGSTRRGANVNDDTVQPGTGVLTLDNRDRRFEPGYAASPYYPYILDGCYIRVKATDPKYGVVYPIIKGTVDKWPVTWPGGGFDGIVQVNITDDMGKLNAALVTNGPWPAELTGARVSRYFDIVFGAGSSRSIAVGSMTVQAYSPLGENALANLRVVEASEDGVLFVAADGTPTFLDLQTQLKSPYNVAAATFADQNNIVGAALPYKQLVPLLDNIFVKNAITVKAPALTDATAVDAASEVQRGVRSQEIETLLTSNGDMASLAAYKLSQTKDAALRFQSMVLDPTANDEIWQYALGLDLRRRVTAMRTPDGGGAAMALDCLIQGVQHVWDTKSWQTTWPLANALSASAWIMDSSALDSSSTKLAFP